MTAVYGVTWHVVAFLTGRIERHLACNGRLSVKV